MTKKKKKENVPEIRIGKPTKKVYDTIEKIAEKEDRTIAWVANNLLLEIIEDKKL